LKSYIFCPEFNCWVVPIPAINEYIGKSFKNKEVHRLDNFQLAFIYNSQLKLINELRDKKMRRSTVKTIIVEDTEAFFKEHMSDKEASVDIETTGLKYFKDDIVSIQFSFDGRIGYFLDWKDINPETLNKFLVNKYQIYANGKFDCKFLRYRGVTNAKIDFDVNYAGHFVYSNKGNSLKANVFFFTDCGGYDNELDSYLRKYKIKNYALIPRDVLSEYGCIDAIMTYRLKNILLQNMGELQQGFYFSTYIPLANLFIEIEMPEDTYYIEGLQIAKRGIAMDIQKFVSEINEVKFVEIFKFEPKPEPTQAPAKSP